MTRTILKLADIMLSRIVPAVRAEAGCITDPYDYVQFCGCGKGHKYGRKCHVYSNCSVSCGPCYAYDTCY